MHDFAIMVTPEEAERHRRMMDEMIGDRGPMGEGMETIEISLREYERLRAERDDLAAKLEFQRQVSEDWQDAHDDLAAKLAAAQAELHELRIRAGLADDDVADQLIRIADEFMADLGGATP